MMNNFKDFFSQATILNSLETIEIEGIGYLECKVDTGNDGYNVIHGTDIEYDDSLGTVSFNTLNNQRIDGVPVSEIISINVGANTLEERPVISLTFKIGDVTFEDCKFTVGDRSSNKQKCLLGRKFLGDKQIFVKA